MNENKSGTPLKPEPKFTEGQMVWDRLDERMMRVRQVEWSGRRQDWWYQLEFNLAVHQPTGTGTWRKASDLAAKDPSTPVFQSGAERPSGSRSILRVAELLGDHPGPKFFIIETIFTSDGMRDRICDGRWYTAQQAQDEIERRMKNAQV